MASIYYKTHFIIFCYYKTTCPGLLNIGFTDITKKLIIFITDICVRKGVVLEKLLLVAGAGAMGTLARYGLGSLVQRTFEGSFPWGTFAVNMAGSFLFGLIWTLAEDKMIISAESRLIFLTGFMGAFTTFSTLMFDTGDLLRDSEYLLAGANIFGQNITGILFLFAGFWLGRLF
jgi:fluoride exporter